ncbi:hypothetical protein Droror1_Dr00011057 [Drosera rotundifolia]
MATTVPNVANHLPIHSSKLHSIRRRGLITPTFQPVCCARLEEHGQPKQYQISSGGKDIWKLFEQAQHNILYMNNQRIRAQEELEKVRRENQLLLQMIEGIEIDKQVDSRKVDGGKDKLSTCWKLLLRIDSLVLTGLIGAEEASELRSLALGTDAGVESFISLLEKNDTELLAELRHLSEQSKKNGFHIVHICTEMDPVISVGSLASYVTGSSRALQRKSHLVEVILPKYKSLDLSVVQGLREIQAEFFSYFDGRLQGNKILTGVVNGIGVTFIQPLHYSSYFEREKVYGYPDDFERFSYFSRASLDYIVKSGKRPDVIHIHNWHTSFVGPLFWDIFVNQGLGSTRIMLTCQDLNSQCHEKPDKLYLCGLDAASLHRPDRLQDHRKSHLVNILKGGIVYSNAVLVSSMESKVSIMKNLSHGLESTLATHKDKLYIAPNGLENSTWNPSEDSLLPVKFSASDMRGKTACKVALQQHTGLPELSSSILVGCLFFQVSKVDLEYLVENIRKAALKGVQFIFVGVSKIAGFNRALKSLEEELKGQNVRFIDEYDEGFSHLILSGSDIILCQSYDDPVLQVPIKAMKYGAAPIEIASIDKRFRHDNDSGSTQLAQYIKSTFAHTSLLHAIDEIRNKPVQWNEKIVDAMRQDFSWDGESYEVHVSAYTEIRKM